MLKIDFYTRRLLKENFLYLFLFVIILFIISFYFPLQIKNYYEKEEKMEMINNEIFQLRQKLQTLSLISSEKIKEYLLLLEELLPENEDFFSIIYALERLSYKTGFRILSYSLSINPGKTNKVSLKIDGEGTVDNFLSFLKNYQIQGRRLITIDEVSFTPQTQKTSLILNFYSKPIKIITEPATISINPKLIQIIESIQKEISKEENIDSSASLEENYKFKDNPFL